MPGRLLQGKDIQGPLEIEADVAIVGSGAGGAVMAAELSEAGLKVVVLEEGGYYETREITTSASDMIQKFYRDAGTSIIMGKPNVIFAEGRCVGGSTVINGGMSWRTPERVLKRWHHELGLDGFSPVQTAGWFEKVEKNINVARQDPGTISRHDMALKQGADRLGYRTEWNLRNQLHCAGTNNCAFGCPSGGKQSMLVSYLPKALTRGATILSDTKISKVLIENGRAVGFEGTVIDRATHRPLHKVTVRAPVSVLAAGATQTPVLLQRQGICNSSGQVGLNFTCHPNGKVVAVMDRDIYGWKGVHQAVQVHEFLNEGLIFAAVFVPPALLAMSMPFTGDDMLEFLENVNRMVIAGFLVEDTTTGQIRPGPMGSTLMTYQIDPVGFERVLRGMALLSEMLFASGAKRIYLPVHGLSHIDSPDEIHRIYRSGIRPTDMELLTVHAMSTCRMSADPRWGVVKPSGETWDVKNLYITDGSIVPTPIGLNPQETIMMLATRQAELLANDWGKVRRAA